MDEKYFARRSFSTSKTVLESFAYFLEKSEVSTVKMLIKWGEGSTRFKENKWHPEKESLTPIEKRFIERYYENAPDL